MENWSVHSLYKEAKESLGEEKAKDIQDYAQKLIAVNLPVIFTLGHLAKITGVDYKYLHDTVNRRCEASNYKMFSIKKRSGGRRFIHCVKADLHRVQQFINLQILQKIMPHPSSFAFHRDGGIRNCASAHCGARWIFQFDLKHFFYDITEIDVYKIFVGLGYRNLLAFELARLCTTTHLPKPLKCLLYHYPNEENFSYPDQMGYLGVLPQGAPSSPMLANLAALELDKKLHKFCIENGFVYTRYADDLTISALEILSKLSIGSIHRKIIGIIRKCRFKENPDKTRISGPGSKKIVLGLLVDDSTPRLSKETFKRIDRHLHATERYGLEATANHEKFDSPFGFYNHLSGLVAFVKDVDMKRWEKFMPRLKAIKVPWQDEIGGFQ